MAKAKCNDPRLTAEQYQALGAAYRRAVGR